MGLFFQVWAGQNIISEKTLLFGVGVQNPKPEGTLLFQAKAYFFSGKSDFSGFKCNRWVGWVNNFLSLPDQSHPLYTGAGEVLPSHHGSTGTFVLLSPLCSEPE